jgi:hypothetical protein
MAVFRSLRDPSLGCRRSCQLNPYRVPSGPCPLGWPAKRLLLQAEQGHTGTEAG